MEHRISRREFSKTIGSGIGLLAISAQGAPARRLVIGHTGITWREPDQAIKDIAGLGYRGFETFGDVLEAWEAKGGLGKILEENKLPIISAYCNANLTDPGVRKDEVDKMVRWGKILKKYGGSVSVIGPNGVRRPSYDFSANKANIVTALNEIGKALADIGVVGAVHQHTGTSIEFRDEVYAVMEAVDPRYVKFGPDIGQLLKGGSDPVPIVKDFLPLIRHVHLKDFNGGQSFAGYCPLGQGKVDIAAIMDLLEKVSGLSIAMVELDSSRNMPMSALETAQISKTYLQKIGYRFQS
jgi:inosose dehydratase